jgi:HK97 family phage portal protein
MADVGAAMMRNPFDPRFWGGASQTTHAGQIVNADTAFQLDVVQSVLGRLSGTVSTLPVMVFRRIPGGKEPAPEHPLYKILHRRPNRFQTSQEFWSEIVSFLAFWRNAYFIIHPAEDGSQAVGELELLHPSRMSKIERRIDGRIYYSFYRLAPQMGVDVYRDDEISHIRIGPLTVDGLRGRYVFETAKETFGRALAVEEFGALYFKNGGAGGGVLEHPGTFKTKEEQEQFLHTWRSGGQGLHRHKDRLLLNNVKYTPYTVQNDQAQFLETLKECAVKLCRLWNMPPHMVGILAQATFNNMEQQSTEYVVYTLAPYIVGLEQAIWRDLLVGDDQDEYFVEFNVAGLLRGDFKTRMQGYAWGRQWGWFSVNDVRRAEGQPDIGPAGDRYLEPMNMSAAGAAGSDSETTAPGGPGTNDPNVDDNDPAP